MKLDGTVALVTGGAKRVGRAIVLELAQAGCDVAIHYRSSRAEAERLAAHVADGGRRTATIAGDLHDPASWPEIIRQTVDALGRLDILVNNASVFLTGQPDCIEDFSQDQWESVLRINTVAPMALCHHAQPHLEAHGSGRIINLCDIWAEKPRPDRLAYCVSKAALEALTKGLAKALAPAILVNGVAPGIAIFPDEYNEEKRKKLTGRVPLAREGTPEEVARLVRFLVESGDYITGQMIPIDGGRSLA
jgi:pteridine reductase